MKNKTLPQIAKKVQVLDTDRQQNVKGGYGRLFGTRTNRSSSRWDDMIVRRPQGQRRGQIFVGKRP